MMMSAKTYDALVKWLHRRLGTSPVVKQDSVFMWVIYAASFMWVWNRRFMDSYTTTIFGRVYFPKGYVDNHPGEAAHSLAHEGVHSDDERRVGKLWFNLSYLFPQVLALLAVLAFVSPWFLLALVCLLPLPAPWREKWERRGYTMTAIGGILQGEDVRGDDYMNWLAAQFSSFNYYRMSWSQTRGLAVAERCVSDAEDIVAGIKHDQYMTDAMKVIQDNL